jgi:hypothetical protein
MGHQPENKKSPVIRRRASVITSSLTVRVYWNKQLNKVIKYLVDQDMEFNYKIIPGDSMILDEYILEIPNIYWATNLTKLAKMLEKCDYKDTTE